jgi:hypothetical protein
LLGVLFVTAKRFLLAAPTLSKCVAHQPQSKRAGVASNRKLREFQQLPLGHDRVGPAGPDRAFLE